MNLKVDGVTPDAREPSYAILEAAALCFEERGYASTSIDDVARRLGSTKGRIYHHFSSKTDLFAAVHRQGMALLHERIEPLTRMEMKPLQKLECYSREHVRSIMQTKAFQRVVWDGVELRLRGSTTPEQREALDALVAERERYSAIFRDQELAARDAGALDFANLSVANQLLFMTLNSPIFWYKPRPGETEQDRNIIINQVVTYALRGLGACMELSK